MSTNTFIGAAGKSWDYGLVWCVGGFVLTGMACLSWFVVAPRFVPLTRQYNSLTVPDFLGSHYRSTAVRRIASAIVAVSSVLYLIAIYRGASIALATFLDLPYSWCVLMTLLVVTAYTLMGGFESVVLTDALQGLLMLVGAVALIAATIGAAGGITEAWDAVQSRRPGIEPVSSADAFSAAMAYSIAVGVKYVVEPRQLSRFYGLRDDSALRTASLFAPIAICVTYLCLLPIGALARVVVDADAISNTDEVIPLLLGTSHVMGPVVGTLFLLVLVSAAMSSIDSVLLVAASTIDRDLIGAERTNHLSGSQAGSLRRTRVWVVVVSLAAAGTALTPWTRDIVRVTKFSGSLYGACFLPVIVVGLFVRNRNARAAIVTMVAGAACVITVFLLRIAGLTGVQEVYPGIAVGLVLYAMMSRDVRSASDQS